MSYENSRKALKPNTHVATVDIICENNEEITATIFQDVLESIFRKKLSSDLDVKKGLFDMKNLKIELNKEKMIIKTIYKD